MQQPESTQPAQPRAGVYELFKAIAPTAHVSFASHMQQRAQLSQAQLPQLPPSPSPLQQQQPFQEALLPTHGPARNGMSQPQPLHMGTAPGAGDATLAYSQMQRQAQQARSPLVARA
jgi:hypothetical protein